MGQRLYEILRDARALPDDRNWFELTTDERAAYESAAREIEGRRADLVPFVY